MLNTRLARKIRAFRRDEEGTVTPFTVVCMLTMVVSTGMAVDFMRQEALRAELQDAVDRGVLAAASLTQSMSPQETLEGYLRSTSFVGVEANVSAQELPGGINSRHITATVTYDVPTYFLKIIGISGIPIEVNGAAIESKQDIELSLVLDVSTSMSLCKAGEDPSSPTYCNHFTGTGSDDSRLDVMRSAASNFIDQMLTEDTKDYMSVSLVPFGGQVDPGSIAFNYLRKSKVHNYSHCLEFSGADFSTVTMPAKKSLDQGQYFSISSYYRDENLDDTIALGWCPHKSSGEEIVYHSNDATKLKNRISNLETHEATGTQYGAKWGAMLLDPSSNALTAKLYNKGKVIEKFSGRPAAYNNDATMKVLVIMSDGRTTVQRRAPEWNYDSEEDREWFADEDNAGYGWNYTEQTLGSTEARNQLSSICTAAKNAGIVVFTIGFDIDADDVSGGGSDASTDMRNCATSYGHYYDVDGEELADAFSAIAATIEKLKLIY